VKSRFFDHIDLRVRERSRAQQFYSKILPALGFTVDKSGEEWGAFEATGRDGKPVEFFGFTEDKNHQPNETRIAFWVETREEVDRVTEIVREAGGRNLEGPQIWPEYSPGYYALFFEDPDGNKLEVCCRGSTIATE
jgi:catechol 2,3-dioxygenase-like lactoylglutathione lyase family enzyme